MSDYLIMCDGDDSRTHVQIKLGYLRSGVIAPRSRTAIAGPDGQIELRCGNCRQKLNLTAESATLIANLIESHPALTVASITPEKHRARNEARGLVPYPALRMQTLHRIAHRLPALRGAK